METEPQIAFENMDPSDALKSRVIEELEKLEAFFGRITAARVALARPSLDYKDPQMYETRIHLVLPGGREVSVSRTPPSDRAKQTMFTSIHDAFEAARRQLQDEVRRMEGKMKVHVGGNEQVGEVMRLYPLAGYGFIETPAGHEVFFTPGRVKHNEFNKIEVGTKVYFSEEMGDDGPYATEVRIARDL